VTLYVVLILLVAWGWWGFATVRDRRQSVGRGSNSIAAFNDRLSVLERTGPTWNGVPAQAPANSGLTAPRDRWATGLQDRQRSASRQLRDLVSGTPLESVTQRVIPSRRPMTLSQAQARRRQMMAGLLGAIALTGLLGLVAGGFFGVLFFMSVAMTATYFVMLVRARAEQIERAIKVRSIERRSAGVAQGLAATSVPAGDAVGWAMEAQAVGGETYGGASYGIDSYGADSRANGSYGVDTYGVDSYA
jgi:predicted lipid-binding transport protein (Tim44 family)